MYTTKTRMNLNLISLSAKNWFTQVLLSFFRIRMKKNGIERVWKCIPVGKADMHKVVKFRVYSCGTSAEFSSSFWQITCIFSAVENV